jgi:hypothetical protein
MNIKKRGILVIVFTLLVLFASHAYADVSGCYLYSENEDVYCTEILDVEAQEDCAIFPNCDIDEFFIPGSDCSNIDFCEEVMCNTDCQFHPLGICQEEGGMQIEESGPEWDLWCNPGCCKIAEGQELKFCSYNVKKFQCEDKVNAYENFDINDVFFVNEEINHTACNEICDIVLENGNLAFTIVDELGGPLEEAKIVLEGTGYESFTDSLGKLTFSDITPGTYSIEFSKKDYGTEILVLILSSGETSEKTITLTKLSGIAKVSGTVTTENGNAIEDATISWTGPVNGNTNTNENGIYEVENLPIGNYSFTASKIGYKAQPLSREIDSEGTFLLSFSLEEKSLQGISGTVYIDSFNNNKVLDYGTDKIKFDAKIYVDQVYKGNSQYPDGKYSIEIEVEEETTVELSATFLNFNFGPEEITLKPGESITKDILLTAYIGECTEPGTEKPAENFTGAPLPGEKAIKLQWTKPCPEVIGYTIAIIEGEEKVRQFSASPAETYIVDDDSNVKWGESYTYEITAHYDHGPATNEETITINVGNEECEGRYDQETGWDTFCLIGEKELRKQVWTCTNSNQLQINLDCSEKDSPEQKKDYYCAPITTGVAECKDQGGCGITGQSADPFGLYYSRSNCYGTNTPEEGAETYCYFDFTSTVVDECKDCTDISSCYDYLSKDACEVDNCLSAGEKCSWVSGADNTQLISYSSINLPTLVTEETGAGYCVEEDYDGNDKDKNGEDFCSLCSPETNLFENFFCTADVCSGLGRCFSEFDLDECSSCGEFPSADNNCYSYNTEHECNGGQNIYGDSFNQLTFSEDRCGWERCFWRESSVEHSENGCVKDGNADGSEDCSEFEGGELESCMMDNSAPRTKIVPEGINIVSLVNPNITFFGDDQYHEHGSQKNKLGVVGLCLTEADANAQSLCEKKNFEEFSYPANSGLNDGLVSVNLLETKFFESDLVNGKTYRLLFYSQDKYLNQEELQEAYLFVDNVPPEFDIKSEKKTIGDVSELSVWLENTNEIMGCTFTLKPVLPSEEDQVITVPREEENKATVFSDLKLIKANLSVTCEDDQGNTNTKSKDFVFDMEERIDIVYPEFDGSIAETSISFKAETAAGATCGLYLTATNEKITDFISNEEGKVHETTKVEGFSEGSHAATHKIVCQEILDPAKSYEDYFHFTVDFTPPSTKIIISEGTRQITPGGNNWKEFFIETALVDFECNAEGFECDKTYYCMGEGCDFIGNEAYTEFTETLELIESTKICYYSTDLGESPVYQPLCGVIKIEGYGIVLDKPKVHYYDDEQWGISNKPTFEFRFFTKVPTTECKIDFYPQFNYGNIPTHQVREISNGYYSFNAFPEDVYKKYEEDCNGDQCVKEVYVKCINLDGLLGPEQKIYLEYDKTAPEIIDAYADPDKVYEGTSTDLFVETDDKTLCKYDDISDGDEKEYSDLGYFFPGSSDEDRILRTLHTDTLTLEIEGASKDYVIATQCSNGAGDLSEQKNIEFLVDYFDQGYILPDSLAPTGIINYNNITLYAETSRQAVCSYRLTGEEDSYIPFSEGTNTKAHSTPAGVSEEGEYSVQLKCDMADHTDHESINFILDKTPPTITNIADGNFSCGSDEIGMMVYTNEMENISTYIYEVYDAGEMSGNPYKENATNTTNTTTSTSSTNTTLLGQLVFSGSYTGDLPVEIETEELTLGRKYKFKVKAIDLAGNEGQFFESNGIAITEDDYPICEYDEDAPMISFVQNKSSCSSVKVELVCNDLVGCKKILYGTHGIANKCNATQPYGGNKISFDDNKWLCYYAEDYTGENHSDVKKIIFLDEDNDGVTDHCDDCDDTPAGKSVSAIGCSDEQIPEDKKDDDSDGDGLPDNWEKMFDAVDCEFSFASTDSNDNGIEDHLEDYDDDGYSNYEEYTMGYNPCLADVYEADEDDVIVETFDPGSLSTQESSSNILALIFLLLGLLMVLGGTGYLIYYYKYSPQSTQRLPPSTRPAQRNYYSEARTGNTRSRPTPQQKQTGSLIDNWKEKISQLRKGRDKKLKARSRANIFKEFGQNSEEIPKVNEILSKKAPHLNKIQELSQHYIENKENIKPGLRHGEKGIFNKLENISNKTKDKKISEVVSKGEAKDIFSKLKTISKKRKSK